MALDPTQTVISSFYLYHDKIYIGLADYRVVIVDLLSWRIIGEISDTLWEVKSVFVDDDYIYIASLNENLAIFDHEYNLVKQIHHNLGVISMYVDKNYIYTGSYGGKVKIWDKTSFENINILEGHDIRVNSICGTGKLFFTGDGFTTKNNTAVRKWDAITHQKLAVGAYRETKRINFLKIFDDKLYSCHGSPGQIRIWDLENFEVLRTFNTESDVKSIDINSEYMIYALKDKLVIIDRHKDEFLTEYNEEGREINHCILQNDIVIYSSRNKIKKVDLNSLNEIQHLEITANTN